MQPHPLSSALISGPLVLSNPSALSLTHVSGLLMCDPCTQSPLVSQGRWPHPHSCLRVAGARPPLTVPHSCLRVASRSRSLAHFFGVTGARPLCTVPCHQVMSLGCWCATPPALSLIAADVLLAPLCW
eukprot:2089392-Rhodomonas_salina.1